jgi:cation-transporting ATPase E
MLILVLATSGFFPVDLRNASAITLFTVGVPTALLAVWARPGPVPRETLQQALARFVVPAAGLASVIGLLVVTGIFLIGQAEQQAGLVTAQEVDAVAKTSVTTFLIYVGVLVLLFTEPPTRLFAVIDAISPDRRPAYLAIILGVSYALVLLIPPLREFFNLSLLGLRDAVIVLLGVATWAVRVWIFWRFRFVDRFLGMDDAAPAAHYPRGPRGTAAP